MFTPRKINIEPDKTPLEDEKSSSQPSFSASMLIFGGVDMSVVSLFPYLQVFFFRIGIQESFTRVPLKWVRGDSSFPPQLFLKIIRPLTLPKKKQQKFPAKVRGPQNGKESMKASFLCLKAGVVLSAMHPQTPGTSILLLRVSPWVPLVFRSRIELAIRSP